jgi:hypothetical protein
VNSGQDANESYDWFKDAIQVTINAKSHHEAVVWSTQTVVVGDEDMIRKFNELCQMGIRLLAWFLAPQLDSLTLNDPEDTEELLDHSTI